jgi:hypothetical protein
VWKFVPDIRGSIRPKGILNRVLKRILGPKWNEITGGWRKLHILEHHDLYSLVNIIGMIKSRRIR